MSVLWKIAFIVLIIVILYIVRINFRLRKELAKSLLECDVRLNEAFEEGERQREEAFNRLSVALVFINKEQEISFSNEAAKKIFENSDLLGVSITELFSDPRVSGWINQAEDNQEPLSRSVEIEDGFSLLKKKKRGAKRVYDLSFSPCNLGEENWMILMVRDVTTEAETEQIRRDFIANASHELRTPMSIIHGYLENLAEGGALESPVIAKKFVGIMRKHSVRMTQIIEDMLVISRLESTGEMPLNAKRFLLRNCIEDVVERLHPVIEENGAKVKVSCQPESIGIVGDRFYWTQILFNLIENALKQNAQREGLVIKVKVSRNQGGTRIEVIDNGKGIPLDDIPFVFKRFYRVDKQHTNSAIKGTGLGLSIVLRAVEAHGGRITLESKLNKKTRFTIEVPDVDLFVS